MLLRNDLNWILSSMASHPYKQQLSFMRVVLCFNLYFLWRMWLTLVVSFGHLAME